MDGRDRGSEACRAPAFRAYNRWLADYCKPYPERLFGVAMLPMQSVEFAIEEMRFARKELGMRSGFVRPNRYNNRQLDDRAYDPLWAEAQELDFAIGIHEGMGGDRGDRRRPLSRTAAPSISSRIRWR